MKTEFFSVETCGRVYVNAVFLEKVLKMYTNIKCFNQNQEKIKPRDFDKH